MTKKYTVAVTWQPSQHDSRHPTLVHCGYSHTRTVRAESVEDALRIVLHQATRWGAKKTDLDGFEAVVEIESID